MTDDVMNAKIDEANWIRGRLSDTDVTIEYRYVLGNILRRLENEITELERTAAAA
jgi:hypothetical protein